MAIPTVTSYGAFGVDFNTCTTLSVRVSDGGQTITEVGVEYNTVEEAGGTQVEGIGTFFWYIQLTPLLPGTTYYWRGYAVNASGTGYGEWLNFTTTQVSDGYKVLIAGYQRG